MSDTSFWEDTPQSERERASFQAGYEDCRAERDYSPDDYDAGWYSEGWDAAYDEKPCTDCECSPCRCPRRSASAVIPASRT